MKIFAIYLCLVVTFGIFAKDNKLDASNKLLNYYKAPKYLIIKNRQIITMQRKLFRQNLAKKIKTDERKVYASNIKNVWKKIDIRDEFEIKNKLLDKISRQEGN